MVSAIVLAGGYATRLRPLSLTKPKALLPILGKPVLDYVIESLLDLDAEVDRIYLALRVMADRIIERYRNVSSKIQFVVEDTPLGDAGPLRFISERYPLSDDVLVVYGDIYSEVNFNDLIKFYFSKNAHTLIVSTTVKDVRRYGVIYQKDGKLIKLIEKPESAESNLINAGIYIFKKELFKYIKFPSSISKDFLPTLLRENYEIIVYEYKGIWADIGLPSDYMLINQILLELKYPKGFIHPSANVSESVSLEEPYYIASNAKVSEDTRIRKSIIGSNSKVNKGVNITNSVIMDNVEISNYSYINGSIIADKCKIGRWNHILEGSILGEEVYTGDGVVIAENVMILPYKEVHSSIIERGKIVL
ncbi:MAG: NDP-sugar synthase [Sulfolobaceae archaeon]